MLYAIAITFSFQRGGGCSCHVYVQILATTLRGRPTQTIVAWRGGADGGELGDGAGGQCAQQSRDPPLKVVAPTTAPAAPAPLPVTAPILAAHEHLLHWTFLGKWKVNYYLKFSRGEMERKIMDVSGLGMAPLTDPTKVAHSTSHVGKRMRKALPSSENDGCPTNLWSLRFDGLWW